MQRDDGTGNFQQNDPEHQSLIDAVIAEINSIFANMADPHSTSCYTSTDFIPDTKIRFVVNKIYNTDGIIVMIIDQIICVQMCLIGI